MHDSAHNAPRGNGDNAAFRRQRSRSRKASKLQADADQYDAIYVETSVALSGGLASVKVVIPSRLECVINENATLQQKINDLKNLLHSRISDLRINLAKMDALAQTNVDQRVSLFDELSELRFTATNILSSLDVIKSYLCAEPSEQPLLGLPASMP